MSDLATIPTSKSEDWRYAPAGALVQIWPIAVEEIHVAAGGSDALTLVQDGGDRSGGGEPIARQILLVLEDHAEFDLTILNLGGTYSRIAVEARLGKASRLFIGGVQLAGANDKLEIATEVTHAVPDATSRQIIRSVAGGTASATYLGKVRVERGADGSDGAQSVRAMLLSPTATANARPELEIYADDVKCAHGCAVGELDAMGLFYLASRGIAPRQAKALMLQAFIAEALKGAADADNLHAQAQDRLSRLLEGEP